MDDESVHYMPMRFILPDGQIEERISRVVPRRGEIVKLAGRPFIVEQITYNFSDPASRPVFANMLGEIEVRLSFATS